MKVNKSGHYVWAPVNSCSLVSLCFKKRGGRCDHEKSPCLFFSSHYRGGGLAVLLGLPPFSSALPLFISPLPSPAFSFCFLFLSPSSSLLSSLYSSSFSSRHLPASTSKPQLCLPSVSQTRRKGEINGVLGEGITQLNFDETRRKKEEGRTSRGGEGM